MVPHVHRSHRSGWLRAGVLGANDGILSVSSLVQGVASPKSDLHDILLAASAGLVAGILSMSTGESVSVSSQADTERADRAMERYALRHEYGAEMAELAGIYMRRGLEQALAWRVAEQLVARDALGAHARDAIGISPTLSARPFQAAFTSAASFAVGGVVPLLAAIAAPGAALIPVTATVSLACLAALGAVAARAGGAASLAGALRVALWGALTMALMAAAGRLIGAMAGCVTGLTSSVCGRRCPAREGRLFRIVGALDGPANSAAGAAGRSGSWRHGWHGRLRSALPCIRSRRCAGRTIPCTPRRRHVVPCPLNVVWSPEKCRTLDECHHRP